MRYGRRDVTDPADCSKDGNLPGVVGIVVAAAAAAARAGPPTWPDGLHPSTSQPALN